VRVRVISFFQRVQNERDGENNILHIDPVMKCNGERVNEVDGVKA
jgi:hypothetical protein